MTTDNFVVHFDIIETATGAFVSHGSCWSSELSQVEVGPTQSIKMVEDKSTFGPTGDITANAQVSYAVVRKQEYPTIEEQVGALWKVIAMLPAKHIPPEAVDMLKRLAEVKSTVEKGAMYVINDGTDPNCRMRYKKVT